MYSRPLNPALSDGPGGKRQARPTGVTVPCRTEDAVHDLAVHERYSHDCMHVSKRCTRVRC